MSTSPISLLIPADLNYASSDETRQNDLTWIRAVYELSSNPSMDSLAQLAEFPKLPAQSSDCLSLKAKIVEWLTPGAKVTVDDIAKLAKSLLPTQKKAPSPLPPRTPTSFARPVRTATLPLARAISEHPSQESSRQPSPAASPK